MGGAMALQSVMALGSLASRQTSARQAAESHRLQELDQQLRLSNEKRDRERALQQSLARQNNRAAASGIKADDGSALLVAEGLAKAQFEKLQNLEAQEELKAPRPTASTGGLFSSGRSLLNLWDWDDFA